LVQGVYLSSVDGLYHAGFMIQLIVKTTVKLKIIEKYVYIKT